MMNGFTSNAAEITMERILPWDEFLFTKSGDKLGSNKTLYQWKNDSKITMFVNPEVFIGLELSLVPEVESVFVERGNGKELRVLSIVNERDPAIRATIYAREQAIIHAYPDLVFDFNIIARRNRDLKDVVTEAGKLAFQR